MRRGAWRALFVGASLVVMAPRGARAEVRPVNLDGCSGGCDSNAMDDADSAQNGVEAKIMMSLIGAGRSRGALLLDPDAVPTVLASGFPSALTPNGGNDAGAHNDATFVDFDYVFTHPDEVGDPTLLLSVASLTGQRTLGDVLFAMQSEAPSSGAGIWTSSIWNSSRAAMRTAPAFGWRTANQSSKTRRSCTPGCNK